MVAPGDQEFFRVTSAPCRIDEAGAVSDAARRANAGDLPGIVARERYSLVRERFLQIGAMNLLRWHRVTRFPQYIHSGNLPVRVV